MNFKNHHEKLKDCKRKKKLSILAPLITLFPAFVNKGLHVFILQWTLEICIWPCCQQHCILSFFKVYALTDVELLSLIHCLWEVQDFRKQFGSFLESFLYAYHRPSNLTPRYLSGLEICPYKSLYMYIYSGFIHKCPKLKTMQCYSTGKWINYSIHAIKSYSAINSS